MFGYNNEKIKTQYDDSNGKDGVDIHGGSPGVFLHWSTS
jgi:hypothetical protein